MCEPGDQDLGRCLDQGMDWDLGLCLDLSLGRGWVLGRALAVRGVGDWGFGWGLDGGLDRGQGLGRASALWEIADQDLDLGVTVRRWRSRWFSFCPSSCEPSCGQRAGPETVGAGSVGAKTVCTLWQLLLLLPAL